MIMYIVAVSTTKFAPRYVAMCLMVAGTYSGYVVALGYISNSMSTPDDGTCCAQNRNRSPR